MKTNLGCSGMVWEVSKLAALLSALMLFSILWSLHLSFSDAGVRESAAAEARSLAAVVDAVGSSPDSIEIKYATPPKVSGRNYSLSFSGHVVSVSVFDSSNMSATYLSDVEDFSCLGGANLTLRGGRGRVEVF